jgi:hypothetical protein
MSLPVSVYIAFDHGPTDTVVTWTKLLDVRRIHTQKGRQGSLSRIEAGRCTVILSNADGRYDPTNSASPEYGSGTRLDIGKRIYVSYDGIGTIFCGHVIGYYPQFDATTAAPVLRIEAIDPLGYLGTLSYSGTPSGSWGSFAHEVIQTVLAAVGWPSGWFQYYTSAIRVASKTYTNINVLDLIQTLVQMTDGTIVIANTTSPDPSLLFTDGDYRTTLPFNWYQYYGGVSGIIPVVSADIVYDRTEIINHAEITPDSGVVQIVDGTTSSTYFLCPYAASYPFFAEADALALAQKLINRRQRPQKRITRMRTTLTSMQIESYWQYAAYRNDINYRIRITVDAAGRTWTSDAYIEGIEEDIDAERSRWEVAYTLAPSVYWAPWKLGDSVDGILAASTYLA